MPYLQVMPGRTPPAGLSLPSCCWQPELVCWCPRHAVLPCCWQSWHMEVVWSARCSVVAALVLRTAGCHQSASGSCELVHLIHAAHLREATEHKSSVSQLDVVPGVQSGAAPCLTCGPGMRMLMVCMLLSVLRCMFEHNKSTRNTPLPKQTDHQMVELSVLAPSTTASC